MGSSGGDVMASPHGARVGNRGVTPAGSDPRGIRGTGRPRGGGQAPTGHDTNGTQRGGTAPGGGWVSFIPVFTQQKGVPAGRGGHRRANPPKWGSGSHSPGWRPCCDPAAKALQHREIGGGD